MNFKINDKNAEEEFNTFANLWDIDTDLSDMSDEDQKEFDNQRRKIIRAIKKGRLSVTKEGIIIYKLQFPLGDNITELRLSRPKGASYINMDRYKEREAVHKAFAVIGDMCGQPVKIISSIDAIDLKPIMAVTTLFLGS